MKSKNKYGIPFSEKLSILAISNPNLHFGNFKDAIDFIIPLNTSILTSQKGIIEEVKLDSKEGGEKLKYASKKYLNYIIIKHENKEFTTYGHLKFNSSKLKKGDKVKRGQIIAKSGLSGLMTIPHLHFHVFVKQGKKKWHTIKPEFDKRFNILKSRNTKNILFSFMKKKKKEVLNKF